MSVRRIEELFIVLGILGALIVAGGSLMTAVAARSYSGPTDADLRREKWSHVVGGLFIAVGFAGSLWRLLHGAA